jgi:hypothetical protein
MPGTVRPYNLVDVLQTIYSAATGNGAGVSTTTPTTVISQVGEADEVFSANDGAAGLSQANRGWGQDIWGVIGWM